MIIYALKTCDTCRKAIKAVTESGLDFKLVDIRSDGIARDDLAKFYTALGDALINRSSTTWRGLTPEEQGSDPVSLLVDHPTLMKRPLIDIDGTYYLGWKADVQAAVLG